MSPLLAKPHPRKNSSNFCLIIDQFLPKDWQDRFVFKGFWFLAVILGAEMVWFFSPLATIDYASHLGGYAVGIVSALWWSSNHEERRRRGGGGAGAEPPEPELNWYEKILGKRA